MKTISSNTDPDEIFLIDKPYTWTSFDVIKKIKNILKIKKVGHAGTLDPLASGLLIICTGKKTKEISRFQNMSKEYTGTFTLGEIRPSYDHETEVSVSKDISLIDKELIHKVASEFTGEILQAPPAHSAIKLDGERAYKLARKGQEFEIPPRKVHVYKFDITGIDLPTVSFRLECSKGFYVRSLARDLGEKLGCGAVLSSLRRTRIGSYSVDNALTIENLSKLRKNEDLRGN